VRILAALFEEFERIGYSVTTEREKQRPIVIRSRSVCLNFNFVESYMGAGLADGLACQDELRLRTGPMKSVKGLAGVLPCGERIEAEILNR
jgi:hypothetical protein